VGKLLACMFIGLIILTTGIYVSTFLTTTWIIVGVLLAVLGGILMGSSSLFLPKRAER